MRLIQKVYTPASFKKYSKLLYDQAKSHNQLIYLSLVDTNRVDYKQKYLHLKRSIKETRAVKKNGELRDAQRQENLEKRGQSQFSIKDAY